MSYTLQGTISMQCVIDGAGGITTKISIVPGNDYSTKHRDESCAVFVPETGDTAIIKKCDPDTGRVELGAIGSNLTGLISSAAVHQTKVEIQVGGTDLKITSITVPAK